MVHGPNAGGKAEEGLPRTGPGKVLQHFRSPGRMRRQYENFKMVGTHNGRRDHRRWDHRFQNSGCVITLQEIEGRSAKEISRITGWSGVAVRVRAHRAAGEAAPGSDPIGEKQPVRDLRQSRRLEIVNGAKPYIPAASALRQVEDIRVTPCSGLFPLTPALSLGRG